MTTAISPSAYREPGVIKEVNSFSIEFTPRPHQDPLPLNGVAAGSLKITAGSQTLTNFVDRDNEPRADYAAPYLSGHPLAEWIAANWYRLRYEPLPDNGDPDTDWLMRHKMTNAGDGYVWPNITMYPSADFQRDIISSQPTRDKVSPIHYQGIEHACSVPAPVWEQAVDQFMSQVLQVLEEAGESNTDLYMTWIEIQGERRNPGINSFRKAEAMHGYDPDEADPTIIHRWLDQNPQV